jgi:hypothetical protein
MLGNRKLLVDAFCEVREFTKACQDREFWDFAKETIVPDAIYLLSRQQFNTNIALIKQLAEDRTIIPILGNPAEGSETMFRQIEGLGIIDLVRQGKIIIITGGYLQPDIPSLYHENFLPKILDYKENLLAIEEYQQQWTATRPYKFLFLNGRGRRHRQQLIQRLSPVLDQSIWSNLDQSIGPVKTLDPKYEFEFYKLNTTVKLDSGYVKYELFNNDWGEIYLNSAPYLDTHFSLVTETVFDYPYTFRTEKIWKPIAIGHPWIAVANTGYYRDIRALGFRTFNNVIDERFDSIEDNQQRLERIALEVEWLCEQDLAKFSEECYNVCKYNQQHLAELSVKIRKEFPERFRQFINERSRI